MAVNHCLVWTVMLAALTGTTSKCQDKHSCTVHLDPDLPLGFLVPQMCCDEVQYPFTFLAHFFNNSDHNITFHFHEYYLLDVEVRLCDSAFYDLFDDYYYPANDYAVQRFCEDDYPYRCLAEREALAASVLSYRSWDQSGYLNITIPVKPRPVLQTHDDFAKRPVFNITYERRQLGKPRRIADEENIANLDLCSFNGFPVLTNRSGNYVFKCQCNNGSEGDKCEWGGGCQPEDRSSQCSGHGECRYYRGSIKCICDEDHFGYRCEHPVSSAQPLQLSVCRELKLECSHMCSLTEHCLCPPHLVLLNKTHCTPRAQLVNVTVKLLEGHHHHTLEDQATKILEDACISVIDASYHNDSKEFHFTMNEKQQDFLPDLSDWRAALNSSVTITITKQDVIWLGPLNKTVGDGRMVLQCTVFAASFPLNVSWFIGQHQIYTLEVDSCEGYKVERVIAVEFIEQSHTKCPNITGCIYDTRLCFNDTSCNIKLTADKYNPDLDWGAFRMVVSHGNTSPRETVVLDVNPQPLVTVTPLSASVYKNESATLICTINEDWKWDDDFEIRWVFPVDSCIFEVNTSVWNVSYLYIKQLNQSIDVTCEVTLWGFCDDRRSRSQRICVAPGCKPQVVSVYYPEPGMPFCPAQMDGTVFWHSTPVGKTVYSDCPEGFTGISTRECKPNFNKTSVWADADYHRCVYQPFYNLIQRTPMLYLKRGYQVVMDPNSTMDEMRQLFSAREEMLNPWEQSLIQEQVEYLFRLSTPPIDLQVFLGLLREMKNRVTFNDTWQLEPLIRMYLSLETSMGGPQELDDLALWRTDIPAQQEVANVTIEYHEGQQKKKLRLKVVMPQGDRKMVRVGAFVFWNLTKIPVGMVHSTNTSNGWVLDHKFSGPVVEVVVMVPTKGNMTAFTKNFPLILSYSDSNVTADRNEKCGGAEVPTSEREPVLWDLGRCTTLGRTHRGRRAIRCRCRGPGLFAFIKVPEIQTAESALKRPLVVALTSCGVVLVLVVVLCILWRSSVPPVPAIRRRCLLGQCDAGCTLLSHLKSRITPYIPCFSTNLKNKDELNSAGGMFELTESQSSCYLESSRQISVRRRVMESCLDTVDPSQESLITVHRGQGSPPNTRRKCSNYLDMDQLNFAHHMYENTLGFAEAEQVQRWCSDFSLENEYLEPDDIQILPFVNDSKSDTDESQN